VIPKLARRFAIAATKSRRLVLAFILGVFFVVPGLVILIDRLI